MCPCCLHLGKLSAALSTVLVSMRRHVTGPLRCSRACGSEFRMNLDHQQNILVVGRMDAFHAQSVLFAHLSFALALLFGSLLPCAHKRARAPDVTGNREVEGLKHQDSLVEGFRGLVFGVVDQVLGHIPLRGGRCAKVVALERSTPRGSAGIQLEVFFWHGI